MELPWTKKKSKIPEGAGAAVGGIAGAAGGKNIATKLINPKDLANALLEFRRSKNAIPTVKLYGKNVIPLTLLMTAMGALSGSKIQDIATK